MRVENVHRSLLSGDGWTVVRQRPEAPVEVGPLAPSRMPKFDAAERPALIMVPDCEVRLDVPPDREDLALRFAAGADKTAFTEGGAGEVTFAIDVDGAEAFRHTVAVGPDRPLEEWIWKRHELLLGGASSVHLRTSWSEELGAPRAGFAQLELVSYDTLHRAPASSETPNVIVILVDTLRADALATYGNEGAQTPHLDALAARGTLFEEPLAPSSWTWPSTASILTSLHVAEHGVGDQHSCFLPQELDSLAEAFQRGGWSTAGFVVNPLIHADKDFDQGFESYTNYEWAPADEVVGDVGEWLDAHGEWRFFLYLHLGDPHEYRPPVDYAAARGVVEPETFKRARWRKLTENLRSGKPVNQDRLRREARYIADVYDVTVTQVDDALGRLERELAARGMLENTVIAFTSDHGEELLEHGLFGHGLQLYDESILVPLILAGPGVPAAERIGGRVENRFLAPTLLRLAGLEPRGNLANPDLLSDAERRAAAGPVFSTTLMGCWPTPQGPPSYKVGDLHSVRHGTWMLFWAPDPPQGEPLVALYDLKSDGDARRDVAHEHPERVERLQDAIASWLAAGAKIQPRVFGGGAATHELLQGLGYVDGDDDE